MKDTGPILDVHLTQGSPLTRATASALVLGAWIWRNSGNESVLDTRTKKLLMDSAIRCKDSSGSDAGAPPAGPPLYSLMRSRTSPIPQRPKRRLTCRTVAGRDVTRAGNAQLRLDTYLPRHKGR